MEKPKRLFPNHLRFSTRTADRFITKARTRRVLVVDPENGKAEYRDKVRRPSRAECVAAMVPRINAAYYQEARKRGLL